MARYKSSVFFIILLLITAFIFITDIEAQDTDTNRALAQEFVRKAEALVKQNKIEEAIELYERIVKAVPDDFEFYIKLATLYEKEGNEAAAIENYKKASVYEHGNKKVYLRLAEHYFVNEDITAAETALKNAITNTEKMYQGNIELQLHDLYRYQGNFEEMFQKAEAEGTLTLEMHKLRARYFYNMGDLKKAVVDFEKAIEMAKESYERSPLSIQLLKAYLKQNRKDLALAFYKDEASKQDKSEIISAAYNLDGITIIFDGDDMRKILIDAYKKRDKLEELRTHFEQKLEEDTTNPAILEILAEIYWETSDYQKAAETYHTLSNIKPIGQWNIRSFYHAAAAFHQNSQFDMSKVVLDQGNTALASINAKQDRHFLGALATICLQNEMYEPALKLTENAVFKTENMKTTLYEILAMNYLSEKRYEDAFEAYQQMAKENDWSFIQIRAETGMNKALTAGKLYEKWIPEQLKQVAENPNDPKPILKLAQCYEATEQTKEAITQYERLAELEPENSQWYAKLGTLYQNLPQGNRQTETAVEVLNPAQSAKSITAYEKAIELEPTSYQLYDLLAKTYLKTAQTSQAEDTYRRALDAPLTKSDHDAAIRAIIGLYADEGQEHKQIAILEEIRQELPKMNNSAVMHELLGDLYKKAGDSDNAELAYAKWMQIRQKELYSLRSVYDYRDFAEKLLDKALYPETALMFAKRAFFDKPFFDNEFPLTLGRASVANGLYDEALRHFKHAFSLITYKYYDWDIFWEDFTETIKIANDKERYIQMLNTLIDSMPSERSNVRAHIYLMIADFYTENETPDYVENYLLKTGFIPETAWITLGPFNNKDNIGYNTEYITENTTQIDLTAKYEGADEQLSWKKFTDAAFNGFINFGKDNDWCVAYAWTTITSPDEREVFFLFCSDDPSKVWLNSTEVFADSIAQTAILDKNTIPVTLKAGVNTILVKVGNEEGTWGFYLRVTDTDGNPYEDLKINKVQSN